VNASLKHIKTLLEADLNVKVALFPADEDPDSFIQKRGTSEFQNYVANRSQNFIELITELKLGEHKHDPIKKADTARIIAENIAAIPDPLKRAAFINETASMLEIPERILIDEVNRFKLDNRKVKDRETRRENAAGNLVPPDIVYAASFNEFDAPPALQKDSTNYQELQLLKTLMLHADKEFEEGVSVAQYIFKELDEDEIWPITQEYADMFLDAKNQLEEHKVLNELFFIRNHKSSKLAADVLSTKHQLSKGWEENYEKFIKTDEDNYKQLVVDNLNYVKLKHIDILMLENQEGLKTAESEEDIAIYQNVHANLQEVRKKITDQLGTVILK